jgi:excisionase family DNA binding protein
MPTAMMDYPKVYTVEEFAQIFKVSPEAVRNLIRRGELPAIRIGKQYRIPQKVLDWYLAQAELPEAMGFGMWSKRPVDSLSYINSVREEDQRSPQEFLDELSREEE